MEHLRYDELTDEELYQELHKIKESVDKYEKMLQDLDKMDVILIQKRVLVLTIQNTINYKKNLRISNLL